MDDFGENLFSYTALACNEHRHIGWGHLHGYPYGMVKQGRVTDNAEALFDALYFGVYFCHGLNRFAK
jgi:hypothetical protein